MAWMKSFQELGQHPKTKRLARRLSVSLPAAIGHLHMLWWWALSYADDGDLSPYSDEDVADACQWDGDAGEFVTALVEAGRSEGHGFLDRDEDGLLRIHDWMEYAGELIEQRKANVQRTKEWREQRKTRNAQRMHTEPVAYDAREEKSREEKKREEDTGDSSGAAAPAPAKTAAKLAKPDSGLREDQVMWNVLLSVFRIPDGTKPSDAARARWNEAIKQFRDAGVKATDLPGLAERYEMLFGKRPPTPHAMVVHLLELRSNAPPRASPVPNGYPRPVMTKQEAEDDEWDRQFAAKVERDKAAALSRAAN